MIRYSIIFLLLFLPSIQLLADCDDPPDCDRYQEGAAIYKHSKTVFYPGEGKIKAEDCLIIWARNEKDLCFSLDTYSNGFNNCGIYGKAVKVRNNVYSFKQKQCQVVLTFLKSKVKLDVKGTSGKFCVDDDLGGGCGMNASVDSATYILNGGKQP